MENAIATETPKRRSYTADILVLVAFLAILFGSAEVAHEWRQPFHRTVEIDLSPSALPYYTLLSFSRGVVAYGISLIFTLIYARWAAYDLIAGRVLIPILDVLQTVPFPAFLAPLELLLVNIVPGSIIGLELTCILVIFTGQVWNMTFSFYYSLKNLPADFAFVGKLARFTWWQKFTRIELPYSAGGLVYNSMISMAGGWFFLTVNESFQIGDQDFRLPGIGSYMSVAQQKGDVQAQFFAVVAMVLMIVAVDQLVWRPLIVWSNKFKIEDTESAAPPRSALLNYLTRSRLLAKAQRRWSRMRQERAARAAERAIVKATAAPSPGKSTTSRIRWDYIALALLGGLVIYSTYNLALLLSRVSLAEWTSIGGRLLLTFARVMAALVLATAWTVPVGIWIGSNPKWSRFVMPLTQIAASFPAPMIFPNIILIIYFIGGPGSLEWGSIFLMMICAQWYILFNVIAGSSAIPQDLRSCAELTHLTRWQRYRTLYLPGIFPALVTGWITAAGGAWNASIVSEYTTGAHNQTLEATGLGATISQALADDKLPLLAASVAALSFFVVFFNHAVWKRLAVIARERYQLLT